MEVINDLILQLDKHAAKQYKIFAKRAADNDDRKDIVLFDLIRKAGEKFSDDKAVVRLYGNPDKNAYYRLKNRLAEDVSLSLFLNQHKNDDQMLCHYLVAMGYYHASRNAYRIAFYFFRRAEKKTREKENYGLLDIIYSQMIKLARKMPSLNPEEYIRKRKENRNILQRMSEVEDILEAFEYRVKVSQNLSNTHPSVTDLLSKIMDEYTSDDELRQSPKVLFGTYYIISRNLFQQKNYVELQRYLINTYKEFIEKQLFNKSNHQQKLQMLAWIANAAFKNKRYSLSLEYAEILHEEMKRFDKLHYDPYEFYYYNVLVINYSAINPAKAIEVLLGMAAKEKIEKQAFNGVFIYFNLALLYFQLKEYKKAIPYLNKLYQHWGYESMDARMKLSAQIGELIMRFELQEYDFLEYRLKQIIKDNKSFLEEQNIEEEKEFLQLFSQMVQEQGNLKKKLFAGNIRQFLEKYRHKESEEDNLFGYNKWLEEKVLKF